MDNNFRIKKFHFKKSVNILWIKIMFFYAQIWVRQIFPLSENWLCYRTIFFKFLEKSTHFIRKLWRCPRRNVRIQFILNCFFFSLGKFSMELNLGTFGAEKNGVYIEIWRCRHNKWCKRRSSNNCYMKKQNLLWKKVVSQNSKPGIFLATLQRYQFCKISVLFSCTMFRD